MKLKNQLAQQATTISTLRDENRLLRDENNVLKRLMKVPQLQKVFNGEAKNETEDTTNSLHDNFDNEMVVKLEKFD